MTYKISPRGEAADFPWIHEADTKYNADGLFHTALALSGELAESFKKEIAAAAEAGHAEVTKDMTPGERKKYSVYYPFEAEVDKDGNETGRTWFNFKQNHIIETKAGERKEIEIVVHDAADKPIKGVKIFNGDEIRILYKPRPTKMTGLKQAGCRLDFAKVQLIKKAQRTSKGFGAIEGGYVQGDDGASQGFGNATEGGTNDGDY
ncbi:hypothetical protein [Taklimakanibacter albus]|uniref:Uncharacterized protein n=1 Tax=Taklimakanibacter albus TaxID=2800327 RepID=A0ACC5RFS1_9HYPH|nr:hypothetical protein [Aestuariivirga sp. YIM B02566]MBK1871546.1 hypothetical protein [Aestuariivirga sp. YIM B02566]